MHRTGETRYAERSIRRSRIQRPVFESPPRRALPSIAGDVARGGSVLVAAIRDSGGVTLTDAIEAAAARGRSGRELLSALDRRLGTVLADAVSRRVASSDLHDRWRGTSAVPSRGVRRTRLHRKPSCASKPRERSPPRA